MKFIQPKLLYFIARMQELDDHLIVSHLPNALLGQSSKQHPVGFFFIMFFYNISNFKIGDLSCLAIISLVYMLIYVHN